MPEPLRWDMILPDGQPLRLDMGPEFRWDGNVPEHLYPSTSAMNSDNKISATISAEDKALILAAFNTIKTKLPFRVNLTPEGRRSTPAIATERGGMNTTFPMEMNAHPELVPSYVDMAEVSKDSALWEALDEIEAAAREVCEGIADTKQVVGNDLLLAYLSFYSNAGQAAKRSVAGIQAVYDNLRRYFRRGGTTPATPPANP